MKKYIFVLLIVIGIFGAIASQALPPVKQPTFYMPKSVQQQTPEKLPPVQSMQYQPTKKHNSSPSTFANKKGLADSSQSFNALAKNSAKKSVTTAKKEPTLSEKIGMEAPENLGNYQPDFEHSSTEIVSKPEPIPEATPQVVAETPKIVQPEAPVVEDSYQGGIDKNIDFNNPYAKIMNEYAQDLETVKNGQSVKNKRVSLVIRDYVNQSHYLK